MVKKLIIAGVSLILLILCIFILTKGIKIGNFKIESIKEIKQKSEDLKTDLNSANDLTKKQYPSEIDNITSAIKELNLAKEEYKNITMNAQDVEGIGVTQIKTYKVEFLWTVIGNYASKEGVTLTLDIAETGSSESYKLNFTVVGNYIGITDFIYDLENDEDLKFEIQNFAMSTASSDISTTQTNNTNNNGNTNDNTTNNVNTNKNTNKNTKNTTKTSSTDGKTLKATFVVNDISIEFN